MSLRFYCSEPGNEPPPPLPGPKPGEAKLELPELPPQPPPEPPRPHKDPKEIEKERKKKEKEERDRKAQEEREEKVHAFSFLPPLSQRLKVRYCDRSSSVVRPFSFRLLPFSFNDIFS